MWNDQYSWYAFSPDNLDTFVDQMLDGKLKPYLKSEPVPTSNDDPVKVSPPWRLILLISSTIDQLVTCVFSDCGIKASK